MRILISILACCFLASGCYRSDKGFVGKEDDSVGFIRFAKGFDIEAQDKWTRLRIRNPWQQAVDVNFEYWLGTAEVPADSSIPLKHYIRVPVSKVICLSTTFIGFIDCLDREHTIAGISGKQYVTCPSLMDEIESGELPDVGYDENLNYEKIVEIQPDVVFIYGITGTVTSIMARLEEMGIKAVVVAEYLEETPLSKLEWLKYMAAFYNLLPQAELLFDSVAARYNRLSGMASGEPVKPSVLLGLPWGGTWYVSGGNSYMASLIHDAGGNYLWKDLPYSDSQPVSLEKVFERAYKADFWINTGDAGNKRDILQVDERFTHIKAFAEDAVYNNIGQLNARGGNAYFESGVVEPDIILADIISVLHPHLLPSHTMKYYRKLQ
jgi:iron complex transport system substrate-binding protein